MKRLSLLFALLIGSYSAFAALPPNYQNAKDLDAVVKFIKDNELILSTLESIDFKNYTISYGNGCIAYFGRKQNTLQDGWVGPAAPLEFKRSTCNTPGSPTKDTHRLSQSVNENCIKENCLNGKGTFKYSTGTTCGGTWSNGELNGWGWCTGPDGDKYEGQWLNDEPHGQGTFTYTNGEKYLGELRSWLMHGQGIYKFANGNKLEGQWEDACLIAGALIYKDGKKEKIREQICYSDFSEYQGRTEATPTSTTLQGEDSFILVHTDGYKLYINGEYLGFTESEPKARRVTPGEHSI